MLSYGKLSCWISLYRTSGTGSIGKLTIQIQKQQYVQKGVPIVFCKAFHGSTDHRTLGRSVQDQWMLTIRFSHFAQQ